VRGVLERKVARIKRITSLLPLPEDPQTEYCLLCFCLALPKLMFLPRAVNTTGQRGVVEEYDRVTREGLCRIMGGPHLLMTSGSRPLCRSPWGAWACLLPRPTGLLFSPHTYPPSPCSEPSCAPPRTLCASLSRHDQAPYSPAGGGH
jgi:hypothetical protein